MSFSCLTEVEIKYLFLSFVEEVNIFSDHIHVQDSSQMMYIEIL